MYFEDASKKQLLQIALWEDCSIDDKYEAVAELQMRQWHDDFLPQLISLWGQGYTCFQIAIELGIDENMVRTKLRKYDLYGRRVKHGEESSIAT